jgi:hypothetical protein
MSDSKFSYYQFNEKLDYQVFLRFEDFDFESQFTGVLEMMGFNKIERSKVKEIAFDRRQTKVLKIVKASPKLSKQIDKSDFSFDKYGEESVSPMGSYSVYKYKSTAMMIFGEGNLLWELGVKASFSEDSLRVVLTRFLSFALASSGVVGFWGVPVDEGFVVMTPKKAMFESIFVDLKKNVVITYDGVKAINSELQILRLDESLKDKIIGMKREALLSYLSTNTCYFSYSGFEIGIKDTIFELSQVASGYIYPEGNFKPRLNEQEAA